MIQQSSNIISIKISKPTTSNFKETKQKIYKVLNEYPLTYSEFKQLINELEKSCEYSNLRIKQ